MLAIARIAFGLFFLGSAILKVFAAGYEMDMMRAAGFAEPLPLYVIAATAQAIAGTALIAGFMVRWACFGLIAYIAIVNYFLHAFWLLDGEAASLQFQLFSKNVGLMFGLLAVAAGSSLPPSQPRKSLDHRDRPWDNEYGEIIPRGKNDNA